MNKFNRGGGRETNLELLRVVSMILIVCLHANYYSLGGVTQEEAISDLPAALTRMFFQLLCIVAVNVFILISGWFGIRPTLKGASSLLFQVFFFSALIGGIFFAVGLPFDKMAFLQTFHLGSSYWFVPSYLVLYTISPILNTFVEQASSRNIISILAAFFFLEFTLGWITNYASFDSGYSPLSFAGLYLITRFLKHHTSPLAQANMWIYLAGYALFSLIPVILFVLTGSFFRMVAYSSPFVVGASICLFLAFTRMSIQSKTINYIGASVFSLYLVHLHPLLAEDYERLMEWGYDYFGGSGYIPFVLAFTFALGIVCVPLDKLRIALWRLLCRLGLDRFFAGVSSAVERFVPQAGDRMSGS